MAILRTKAGQANEVVMPHSGTMRGCMLSSLCIFDSTFLVPSNSHPLLNTVIAAMTCSTVATEVSGNICLLCRRNNEATEATCATCSSLGGSRMRSA